MDEEWVPEEGDTVYVGGGTIHWVIEHINPKYPTGRQSVVLRSGMSDRRRSAWITELRLHSKKGVGA